LFFTINGEFIALKRFFSADVVDMQGLCRAHDIAFYTNALPFVRRIS